MKALFYILVALNIVVFGVMIGSRVLKQHFPATPQTAQQVQPAAAPPQVIINMADYKNDNGQATASGGNVQVQNGVQIKRPSTPAATANNSNKNNAVSTNNNKTNNRSTANVGAVRSISVQGDAPERHSTPRVQYKACSARVSIPEDDYHRIKGLLRKYPHAASRQVVQGGGEGNSQSSSRMNVLFMSVNDQEAGAIQGVVGRYGQLNRTPCDR